NFVERGGAALLEFNAAVAAAAAASPGDLLAPDDLPSPATALRSDSFNGGENDARNSTRAVVGTGPALSALISTSPIHKSPQGQVGPVSPRPRAGEGPGVRESAIPTSNLESSKVSDVEPVR